MALYHSIFTVALFIAFIALVIWAYSGRRKQDFDEAANLPFVEEDKPHNDSQHTRAEQSADLHNGDRS